MSEQNPELTGVHKFIWENTRLLFIAGVLLLVVGSVGNDSSPDGTIMQLLRDVAYIIGFTILISSIMVAVKKRININRQK